MKKVYLLFAVLLLGSAARTQEVSLELFSEGLSSPLAIEHAGDQRLFVVEKHGKIKIVQPDGTVNSVPFLDISNRITTEGERGLLGLAFHPDFSANGYFYVNYTNLNGNTRVSRFEVSSGNQDTADPESEVVIIGYDQPDSNHNGGCLLFGPDGNLFISSGDGGGSGDPHNNGQSTSVLLGKILRIDVDNPSGGKNYGIPADNPFVSDPDASPEIWAYGLRNPWRMAVDRIENTLWIADVGQASREEINRQSLSESGLNYGWRCYEGTLPFNTQNCPPQSEMTFPLAEYSHDDGNCSITGGYVYRGSKYSDIEGLYFFADYCSGMIGTSDQAGNLTFHGNFDGNWVSFGEDRDGELYIADINGGKVFKIKGGELVSAPDFSLEENLKIFPNPAREEITIQLTRGKIDSVQIFDIFGKSLLSQKNPDTELIRIPLSGLSSGVYLMQVFSGDQNLTKKLIIE